MSDKKNVVFGFFYLVLTTLSYAKMPAAFQSLKNSLDDEIDTSSVRHREDLILHCGNPTERSPAARSSQRGFGITHRSEVVRAARWLPGPDSNQRPIG